MDPAPGLDTMEPVWCVQKSALAVALKEGGAISPMFSSAYQTGQPWRQGTFALSWPISRRHPMPPAGRFPKGMGEDRRNELSRNGSITRDAEECLIKLTYGFDQKNLCYICLKSTSKWS